MESLRGGVILTLDLKISDPDWGYMFSYNETQLDFNAYSHPSYHVLEEIVLPFKVGESIPETFWDNCTFSYYSYYRMPSIYLGMLCASIEGATYRAMEDSEMKGNITSCKYLLAYMITSFTSPTPVIKAWWDTGVLGDPEDTDY